jgi:lambda family phage minor tail protein L
MSELATDQLKQEIDSGLLEFFELKLGEGTNNTLYFHDGKNENLADISFAGNTYISLPIMMDGIELSADGAMSRPTLTIANVESILKAGSKFKTQMEDGTWGATVDGSPLVASDFKIDHLVGSVLTKRKTLEKYLTSNPIVEFEKDEYIIDRIKAKDNNFITLELASPFDLGGIRIPNRVVVGKYCPWVYQGAAPDVSEANRLGGCNWKKENQKLHNNTRVSVFVSEEDEPILLKSAVEGLGSGVYFTSKASSHDLNDFVKTGDLYYQSRDDSNTAALTSEVFWRVVRVYTEWSSDSGSTSYTVNADVRKSSHVYYANTVWRCIVAHTKNSSFTPELSSQHWVRADLCGKLLKSCKQRYQASGMNASTGRNFIASDRSNTTVILPFGGFPGSRKFR